MVVRSRMGFVVPVEDDASRGEREDALQQSGSALDTRERFKPGAPRRRERLTLCSPSHAGLNQ